LIVNHFFTNMMRFEEFQWGVVTEFLVVLV